MSMFASIYVGSYETILKVFDKRNSSQIKEIDCQRFPVGIVQDIYHTGEISSDTIQKLADILGNMSDTVDMYRISNMDVYAGPTVGKASNYLLAERLVRGKSRVEMKLLSNSEQRFLSYMAVASRADFDKYISKSAVLVDIGGASLQITLFINGKVETTQHINIGTAIMRENLRRLSHYIDRKDQILQIMNKEIGGFINMHVPRDVEIENLIILEDNLTSIITELSGISDDTFVKSDEYVQILDDIRNINHSDSGDIYNIGINDSDILDALILFHKALVENFQPKYIFTQNVSVNEGMAYNYYMKTKDFKVKHDFNQDILTAAWAIARRYNSYQPHLKALEYVCSGIFNSTRKYHGLENRCKLLLSCVAILHDCGKYISISQAADCSYSIIMNSEILGLSHHEREIIATTVKYAAVPMDSYELMADRFSEKEYIDIMRMVAIFKVANALDRSHRQKFKNIKVEVKKNELVISVEAKDSLSLEKGMFEKSADFFEKVFDLRPVVKEKRVLK